MCGVHVPRSGFLTCRRTFEQEVATLKEMQTHGRIRKIMQGTEDGARLLRVYRCIKNILDDLQVSLNFV